MLCSGNTVLQGCSILPSLIGGACACLGRHFRHRCQLLNFQCQAVSRLCDCCPNLTPVDHIIYQPILETNWDKESIYKARLASVQKYGQMPLSVQCVAHDNGMQLYMHGIDRLQVQAALLLICFQVKRVCVDG